MVTNRVKYVLLGLAVVALTSGFRYHNGRALLQAGHVFKKCAALVTPRSVLAQSGVLWSANMETAGQDLSQWYFGLNSTTTPCCSQGSPGGGIFNSGSASAGPSMDVAHTGTYSALLKINTPSTPTSGTRLFRWAESQAYPDLYYGIWYYFPQVYTPTTFWNVFAWKSNGTSEGNNPFFILNVGNRPAGDSNPGAMFFYLYDQVTRTSYTPQTYKNIPVGGWTHVEAHYICDPANGHVTFWQDGTQIFDVFAPTRYSDGDCQWNVNNYSDSISPTPASIYVDDAKICSGGRCP
jgi:hypothetical protein